MSARQAESANSLTLTGVWLFFTGLSVTLSGIKAVRMPIGGLLLQPYLVFIGLAFPLVLLARIAKFPLGPLIGWIIFAVTYAIASLGPATEMMSPLNENIKVLAAIVAIVTVALLVRSRSDFIFGAAGLVASMAILAVRGLQSEDELAADKLIDVANKNSYSIYALPAVLLALYIVLRFDWKNVALKRFWFWIPMLVCAGLASYGILAGGNRSGYLGLAFIVFELFIYSLLSPRFKIVGRASAWLLVSAATASVIGLLIWRQATSEFERRYEQTVEGTQSDRLRLDIAMTSLKLAMENPISGKTPQQLPYEIGRRLAAQYQEGGAIDTHNVFAHLLGGTGFVCFASLFAIAGMLMFWKPKLPPGMQLGAGFYDARNLLRMMLLLWALRGLFTREILYNPGFCMGIGLAIGLCIVEAGLAEASSALRPGESRGRTLRPMLTA
ncbi:MAG TPA: O-antigen ligase family protein [Pirellulales bacterium]|nr:O-antigen ligase family protein [Pirellulales bacterium]